MTALEDWIEKSVSGLAGVVDRTDYFRSACDHLADGDVPSEWLS